MRVAIDATIAVTGGGVTYLLNLLPALAAVDNENQYQVWLSSRQVQIQPRLPSNFRIRRVSFPTDSILWRVVWEQTLLPVWLSRQRIDVLFAPADITPLAAPCPVLLAVRNPWPHATFTPEGTWRAALRRTIQRQLTRLSCRKAARVIFVSQASSDDLGAKLGVPAEKRVLVYHGIGTAFRTMAAAEEAMVEAQGENRRPYVLCVSALYPHKDIETLIDGFARYVSATGDTSHQLVLVGRSVNQRYTESLRSQVRRAGLADRVEFVGEVPYENVREWYARARAFVLPSRLETFGHPLVEAMASGVPIICTDMPVTREICHEASLYFKPRDAGRLAELLDELLNGPPSVRASLSEQGQARASSFSWERTARETLRLLEQAAEGIKPKS
jgi:glycosyltransferase involved in cell wall biosynthesis